MIISIVISTYNKLDSLKTSLSNLLFQNADREKFEVIIIVDGSTDETVNYLDNFKSNYTFDYKYKDNGGLVSARNFGIKYSHGDYVLFMDDDIILNPDYIRNLYTSLILYPDRIHAGNLFNVEQKYVAKLLNDFCHLTPDTYPDLQPYCISHPFYEIIKLLYEKYNPKSEHHPAVWWAFITGGNICIPRSILNQVGVFDENIEGWGPEDADLAYRIFKKGYLAHYNRDCKLFHLDHPRNNKKIVQSMVKYAFMLYKKYNRASEWMEYLKFFNGLISLEEFNNNCASIFGLNSISLEEYYIKDFMNYRESKLTKFRN